VPDAIRTLSTAERGGHKLRGDFRKCRGTRARQL
jgi:hypothetical protein